MNKSITTKLYELESYSEMEVFKFFKDAGKQLEYEGYEDASFAFEQITEWLKTGKRLPTDRTGIIKALGL